MNSYMSIGCSDAISPVRDLSDGVPLFPETSAASRSGDRKPPAPNPAIQSPRLAYFSGSAYAFFTGLTGRMSHIGRRVPSGETS